MSKRALVTGSEGLIGREFCKALLHAGYEVYCFDIKDGEDVTAPPVDASYFDVDVLINCAAINPHATQHPGSAGGWWKSFEVNVYGTYLMGRIVAKYMRKRGGGNIVNMGSTYGIVAPDQRI
ncbi:unnamed protein product, partial [marine sediment metagenome]